MSVNNFRDVGTFHHKFGLDHVECGVGLPIEVARDHKGAKPRVIDPSMIDFRRKFMQEELDEFGRAFLAEDEPKMFDALLDLAYVVFGTAHLLGYPWQEGWDEVQRANMQKERATSVEQSLASTGRGSTLDVIKPVGRTPPNISAVLGRHGWMT